MVNLCSYARKQFPANFENMKNILRQEFRRGRDVATTNEISE